MRFLFICYVVAIVTGATALNYRVSRDDDGGYGSSSGSGSRFGGGGFGGTHK